MRNGVCIHFHGMWDAYACDRELLQCADYVLRCTFAWLPWGNPSPTWDISALYVWLHYPASSPLLSEPSELVPGVGVGVESRPFSLSMGCYWWGEVMDLPAVLTGTLRINQTVGKTQPAIPPLSRLNCHFISFIYGGSALFWTPPLSILPLKMPPFFFFLPYRVLWQPTYTLVLLSSLFPGKICLPHIFPGIIPHISLVYVEVKIWAACEPTVCDHVVDKGWIDSVVL